MKARWKYEKNEADFLCFEICQEYPNCKCSGHYVWEDNKKLKEGEGKK